MSQPPKWIFISLMLVLLAACAPILPDGPETKTVDERLTITPSPKPSKTAAKRTPAGKSTATATPGSSLNLDAEDLRGAIIHFWHPWSGQLGDAIKELVDSFNIENPWKIFVVPVYQGSLDGLSANVVAFSGTRDQPDVVIGYLHQAQVWDSKAGVADLDVYVNDPIWGLSLQEQSDFYPVFWEADSFDKKRYGLPALRSGQLLYYNVSWARDLGFGAAPRTIEQFEEQACAAANAILEDDDPENDGAGGWIISTEYPTALGWLYAFGAEIQVDSSDVGAAYKFNTPEVEGAFTFLRQLYDDGCAWLPENHYPQADFVNRQGLFGADSVMGIPYQAETFQQINSKDLWTVIPFPGPEEDPAFDVYGPSYVLLTSSAEQQLASWVFVKWLSEPQNQSQLVQASGSFPLRLTALEYLDDYSQRYPQWRTAVEALSQARSEPNLQSWGMARWAVQDAVTQLFRFYFKIEQAPGLVEFLDRTVDELQQNPGAEVEPDVAPWVATPETTNSPDG